MPRKPTCPCDCGAEDPRDAGGVKVMRTAWAPDQGDRARELFEQRHDDDDDWEQGNFVEDSAEASRPALEALVTIRFSGEEFERLAEEARGLPDTPSTLELIRRKAKAPAVVPSSQTALVSETSEERGEADFDHDSFCPTWGICYPGAGEAAAAHRWGMNAQGRPVCAVCQAVCACELIADVRGDERSRVAARIPDIFFSEPFIFPTDGASIQFVQETIRGEDTRHLAMIPDCICGMHGFAPTTRSPNRFRELLMQSKRGRKALRKACRKRLAEYRQDEDGTA